MAEQIEILVVDDDKEIANLVEIYLSSTGYKIHKAYNAVDGLALLQKYDIKKYPPYITSKIIAVIPIDGPIIFVPIKSSN